MKKILLTAVVTTISFLSFYTIPVIADNTPENLYQNTPSISPYKISVIPSKHEAYADGKDIVRVTITSLSEWGNEYVPVCTEKFGGTYSGEVGTLGYSKPGIRISITGSGNKIEGATLVDNTYFDIPLSKFDCKTGTVVLNWTSTELGSKNFLYGIPWNGGESMDLRAVYTTVNFNSAPKTTVAKPINTTKPTAPASVKPTLTLKTTTKLTSANKTTDLTLATTTPIITTKNKLTFSGTTSPNAKVTLTIHSDPITAEVTADAQGAWTYTLDPQVLNLPTGEHIVTAVSTDTNGISSDSIELTKFTLNPTPQPVEPLKPEPYNYFNRMTIGGGVAVLILIVILVWVDLLRRKRKTLEPHLASPLKVEEL